MKGLNATEIDNMIIALPGDQEAVAYLMPFSVISGSRHLDLLVGTLHQTNKTLSKMTGGRALESKQNEDYVQATLITQTWLEEEFPRLEIPKLFEPIMHAVSLTKENMTSENPDNVYFRKSDVGGAGNVDLLYANMMLALTQHINQHTLAREEKALRRQVLLSIENLRYNHLKVCFNGDNEYMMKTFPLYVETQSCSLCSSPFK